MSSMEAFSKLIEPEVECKAFLDRPGYYTFITGTYQYFRRQLSSSPNWTVVKTDLEILQQNIRAVDILFLILSILTIHVARGLLTEYFFKPLCRWRKLSKADAEKVPESGWKFLFYLFSWSLLAKYMFGGNGIKYLINGKLEFDEYSLQNLSIESDVYWIYAIEFGYYFHSLYTTLAVDLRRKDTPAMFVHHLLTITLMIGTFTLG